jgi:hypothetical protein
MMGRFFDAPETYGTNRVAAQECETCDGHRLVPLEEDGREVYARCPVCNPAPVTERQPVDARWKNYDR